LALQNRRFASPKTIKRLLVTEVEDLRVTSISRCVQFHVKRSSSPCAPTAQDTKQFAYCSGIKITVPVVDKISLKEVNHIVSSYPNSPDQLQAIPKWTDEPLHIKWQLGPKTFIRGAQDSRPPLQQHTIFL
jgi:hypothetical protein